MVFIPGAWIVSSLTVDIAENPLPASLEVFAIQGSDSQLLRSYNTFIIPSYLNDFVPVNLNPAGVDYSLVFKLTYNLGSRTGTISKSVPFDLIQG